MKNNHKMVVSLTSAFPQNSGPRLYSSKAIHLKCFKTELVFRKLKLSLNQMVSFFFIKTQRNEDNSRKEKKKKTISRISHIQGKNFIALTAIKPKVFAIVHHFYSLLRFFRIPKEIVESGIFLVAACFKNHLSINP